MRRCARSMSRVHSWRGTSLRASGRDPRASSAASGAASRSWAVRNLATSRAAARRAAHARDGARVSGRLEGRVALISGGGRGQGAAHARREIRVLADGRRGCIGTDGGVDLGGGRRPDVEKFLLAA